MFCLLAFLVTCAFSAAEEVRVLSGLEETRGAAYWTIAPRSWIEMLKPLAARRASEGMSVVIVPLEIFAQDDAAKRSEAIREFFRSGAARWKEKPRFLLLAAAPQEKGILPFVRDWSKEDVKALDSLDGRHYRAVASDHPFALLDNDDLPDLAVGRLPARSGEELKSMVGKTLDYERSLPGLWRRRVLLLGGLFGDPKIDAVVEAAVSGLLDREIPYDFDLQVLRAEENSPYGVGIEATREFFAKQMQEGALIAIYAGHAGPGAFSTPVAGRKNWEDLFTLEEAGGMKVRRGAPLLMSFACHAGGFALESKGVVRETIADTAMRNPQGPIAYLGASGISDPIPDLLLAHELTRLFGERRELRLGELLVEAKKAALQNTDEFHKQVAAGASLFGFGPEKQANLMRFEFWIYNLHGDPALQLQRPKEKIELSHRRADSGKALEIEGKLPGWKTGDAIVSLEFPRSMPAAQGSDWKRANDKTLVKGGAEIQEGRFSLRLSLPDPLAPGRYYLKAYASAEGRDGSGSLRVEISQ